MTDAEPAMIRARGLRKSFGKPGEQFEAVKGIDVDVHRGEADVPVTIVSGDRRGNRSSTGASPVGVNRVEGCRESRLGCRR